MAGPALFVPFDMGTLVKLDQFKSASRAAGAELNKLDAQMRQAAKSGQEIDQKTLARYKELESIKSQADTHVREASTAKKEWAEIKGEAREAKHIVHGIETTMRGVSSAARGDWLGMATDLMRSERIAAKIAAKIAKDPATVSATTEQVAGVLGKTAITLFVAKFAFDSIKEAVESYHAEKELERRVGEMLNSPKFTEWEKQQALDRIRSKWQGFMEKIGLAEDPATIMEKSAKIREKAIKAVLETSITPEMIQAQRDRLGRAMTAPEIEKMKQQDVININKRISEQAFAQVEDKIKTETDYAQKYHRAQLIDPILSGVGEFAKNIDNESNKRFEELKKQEQEFQHKATLSDETLKLLREEAARLVIEEYQSRFKDDPKRTEEIGKILDEYQKRRQKFEMDITTKQKLEQERNKDKNARQDIQQHYIENVISRTIGERYKAFFIPGGIYD